jgi:hypothetical protein
VGAQVIFKGPSVVLDDAHGWNTTALLRSSRPVSCFCLPAVVSGARSPAQGRGCGGRGGGASAHCWVLRKQPQGPFLHLLLFWSPASCGFRVGLVSVSAGFGFLWSLLYAGPGLSRSCVVCGVWGWVVWVGVWLCLHGGSEAGTHIAGCWLVWSGGFMVVLGFVGCLRTG